jgi:hypothetical protein
VYLVAIFPVSVSLVDAYGRPATKHFDVNAATHGDAVTAAGALMTDLAGVTELRILSYVIGERVTYTDTVDAGANRDEGVTFSVRTADNEKAVIKVPGPVNAIFNGDGSVDLTDGAVTAFIANYLAGTVLVDDGETVTELISGRLDK